eukprot:TRINITY_DN21131_c0_g1_i2.p1 TRINITY_DN21131_c0_g1~~TRINITY_DN21131_c0_g1_i2.p1  ORF type:complete len:665 (-),score=64.24 TRINITY_DN21131_c0_g1_i2:194-2188(-)
MASMRRLCGQLRRHLGPPTLDETLLHDLSTQSREKGTRAYEDHYFQESFWYFKGYFCAMVISAIWYIIQLENSMPDCTIRVQRDACTHTLLCFVLLLTYLGITFMRNARATHYLLAIPFLIDVLLVYLGDGNLADLFDLFELEGRIAGCKHYSGLSGEYLTDWGVHMRLMLLTTFWIMFILPSRAALLTLPVSFMAATMLFVTEQLAREKYEDQSGAVHWTESVVPSGNLWILPVSHFLVAGTRASKEHHLRLFFLAFESQTQEVIRERVLRCQAEFQSEALHADMRADDKTLPVSELRSQASSFKSLTRTIRSGPAAQVFPPRASIGSCKLGDCLPGEFCVYVEGFEQPQQLQVLQQGQRVLCYDSLLERTSFAEIKTLGISESSIEDWVALKLYDGSTYVMSKDHPVRVCSGGVVPAMTIEPGVHQLRLQRQDGIIKVLVKQVLTLGELSEYEPDFLHPTKPPCRVTLIVRNGMRYEPLVVPPDSEISQLPLAALGSADLDVGDWLNRKSSYEYKDDTPGERHTLQRSRSAPGSVSLELQHVSAKMYGSDKTSRSQKSSMDSGESIASDRIDVKLNPSSALGSASLSELRALRQAGLSSRGSATHAKDQCIPCDVHRKHLMLGRAPCVNGILCNFCHEDHVAQNRVSRRQVKERRAAEGAKL